MEEQLQLILEACDSLHSSVHLANVVHGLLASGNHLNYGAASTGAPGMPLLYLPHLLSLTCRLKVCKLASTWVHEQHCACQQRVHTLLYRIQQLLKLHQNLDSKVAGAEAICMHLWLPQSLLQCRLQDRWCGHSSWCEGLAQGESAACGAEAAQVP